MIDYTHEDEAFLPNGDRNPFYPQPIVPDEIHLGPIHEKFPPKPRTVTIEENNKVAEIRDAFKNLRYKISLTSFEANCFPKSKEYQIQVVSYFGNNPPIVLVTRPEVCEKRIYCYDLALKIYNDYVAQYTHLIKAETADIQDMTIYKDQIGYKMTNPKCCFTCKWCQKRPIAVEYELGVVGKLECHNPKNKQAYRFDCEHRHDPWHEHCHDPMITPPHNRHHCEPCHPDNHCFDHRNQDMIADIHPKVEFLGVCDNYEQHK